MDFSYAAYKALITSLNEEGYLIRNYHNNDSQIKEVIIRHDVDLSVEAAVAFSAMEKTLGISSTYYILTTSRLYNPAEKGILRQIKEIIKNGHEIGLHFDETQYLYEGKNKEDLMCDCILKETKILEAIIGDGYRIKTVSMHMPSQSTLEMNLKIPGMVNSYSQKFFKTWKYLSDSEMRWREDVNYIIRSQAYNKLHILTHPFWWDESGLGKREKVGTFLNGKRGELFDEVQLIVPGLGE